MGLPLVTGAGEGADFQFSPLLLLLAVFAMCFLWLLLMASGVGICLPNGCQVRVWILGQFTGERP